MAPGRTTYLANTASFVTNGSPLIINAIIILRLLQLIDDCSRFSAIAMLLTIAPSSYNIGLIPKQKCLLLSF